MTFPFVRACIVPRRMDGESKKAIACITRWNALELGIYFKSVFVGSQTENVHPALEPFLYSIDASRRTTGNELPGKSCSGRSAVACKRGAHSAKRLRNNATTILVRKLYNQVLS